MIDASMTKAKKAVLEKLKSLGIGTLICPFNGEGDSGWIEEPVDKRLEGHSIKVLVKKDTFDKVKGKWKEQSSLKDTSLSNAIYMVANDILEDAAPGWEINDGAEGHVLFDSEKFSVVVWIQRREMRLLDPKEIKY